MTGFWISAAAMVLMVVVLVLNALRQTRSKVVLADGHADLEVYRDQLVEIDRDLSRGILAPAESERLRVEVQRRMLSADRMTAGESAQFSGASQGLAIAMLVLCLGAGIAIYAVLGLPDYPDLPLQTRLDAADRAYSDRPSQNEAEAAQPPYVQPTGVDPELAAMIDKLRTAVATRPGDLVGHSLLAQNEAALGNYVAARKAQELVANLKAEKATGEDFSLLAQFMIMAAGGIVSPEAEQALVRCLQLDPRNGWARYYSGLMFAEIGRPDRTFGLWEPLLREGPADAPWIQPIRSLIEEVASAAGINFALPSAGPDGAAVAAASQMSDADRADMIKTMVAGLEARLNSDGGAVEEWAKLITSLGVLKDGARAKAAYVKAQQVFAGKPGELAALRAAAVQAGVTP